MRTMEEIEKDADSEDIYMNIDDIETKDNESGVYVRVYQNSEKAGSKAAPARGQVCSGCPAAVCLGLLCVLLLAVITGLSIKHNVERETLWSSYTNISKERDQLQSSYINVSEERDQLQSSYNDLLLQRKQLQSRYDNITKEREHLSGTNRNLTLEKNNLKTSCETLTLERDAFHRQLTEIDVACPVGWTRFMTSCYYISSISNSWDQSRQDCMRKSAELVIINSSEEQKFVSGFGKQLWIGLTDRDTEGSWKWVDGTSLVSGYWGHGEPNNVRNMGYIGINGDEDCAQIGLYSDPLSSWNDLSCNNHCFWICEKKTRCTFE